MELIITFRKKIFSGSLFVMILFSVSSCTDFFSTRDPEIPVNNQNITYPTSITELVENFKESFREKKIYTYETLFSDSLQGGDMYVFESRAADVMNVDIFKDWSIENEVLFLENFMFDKRFSQFNIVYDEINETLEDSSIFEFDYDLILTDDISYEERLVGHSIFKIIRVNNIWTIKRWIDEFDGTEDAVSISKIKVQYSE